MGGNATGSREAVESKFCPEGHCFVEEGRKSSLERGQAAPENAALTSQGEASAAVKYKPPNTGGKRGDSQEKEK